MFFNDHAPPHFHAFTEVREAKVNIATGELFSGRLGPATRKLLKDWTLENQAALMQNWERARRREPLERIPDSANDL